MQGKPFELERRAARGIRSFHLTSSYIHLKSHQLNQFLPFFMTLFYIFFFKVYRIPFAALYSVEEVDRCVESVA